jgi:hypothetical protein
MNRFFLNFPGHPHAALQPRYKRFGLFRFRSPLLTESRLISVPVLLRWFTSHSIAPPPYFIQTLRCRDRSRRVTPFGHPRIREYLLLPAAFRSLSRPSSPCSSIGIHHGPIVRLTILLFPLEHPSAQLPASFRQALPFCHSGLFRLFRFPSLLFQRSVICLLILLKKTFESFH